MINIVKQVSSEIRDGFRRIKVIVRGATDARTPYESAPFGIDGLAPLGWRALFSESSEKGKPVIIGYVNKGQLDSLVTGENRMYSTDEDGVLSTFIYLRGDGTMEIGGDADFMVRFNELKTAFDQFKTDHDDTVSKLNAVINALQTWVVAPNDGGLALQVAAALLSNASNTTADIDPAKIAEIKTL